MNNPWNEIEIDDYEKHMSLGSIYQLQTINQIMKEQFYTHSVHSVMVLGIAGGNGLEHINTQIINKVYGVDINENYLNACKQRYPALQGILETLCVDLTQDVSQLPYADLLIANLLIEYVGYECFQIAVEQVAPKYVSCMIQVNVDDSFVSDSPYIHVFDRLVGVLHSTEENELIEAMHGIGYQKGCRFESKLPNGKKLVRVDFIR